MEAPVQGSGNEQIAFMLEDAADFLDGVKRIERMFDHFQADDAVIRAVSDRRVDLGDVAHQSGAVGIDDNRTLIRFVAPERDANKLMLKNGNDLWFYDPASQASIRLSPQQRLLGQASNGDVVTVNLAKDYKAELLAEEDTADGERVMRRAYKLGLSAVSPDVTYHRVEMWVDAASSRPIKARFFSESGHLLKTAYYRKYQPQLDRERPSEVVIIDGLDPSWVTVLRYSDYAWRDVPDAWLQRDYLPRFKPG